MAFEGRFKLIESLFEGREVGWNVLFGYYWGAGWLDVRDDFFHVVRSVWTHAEELLFSFINCYKIPCLKT